MKKFMKFFGKLLVCLCLVSTFFLGGCSLNTNIKGVIETIKPPITDPDNPVDPEKPDVGNEVMPDFDWDYIPHYDLPDPSARFTLTLQSGNGITFEGGTMTASLARGDHLPTLVKSNDREIIEVYDVAVPATTWTTASFTMPEKNIEIAPVYQRIGQLLNLPKVGKEGSSANSGQLGDKGSADMLADASVQYPIPQTIFSGIDGIIKDENGIGEKGVVITAVKPTTPSAANPNQTKAIPGITAGGSFFRVKTYMGTKGTAEGVLAKTYTFHFNFQNYDTEELNFEVIQVRGGTDMGTNQGATTSEMITLAPGEGKRVSLTITFTDTNDNGMTIIRFKTGESHEELKLGMSMSKVNPVA